MVVRKGVIIDEGQIRGANQDAASRTRRELLAAATGGLGVLAAQAALPAAAAQAAKREPRQSPAGPAAQGSAVIEGRDNTGATARTAVFTSGNKEFGILADPNSS